VVRLNNATYDREKFIKNGINHIDLYFLDGSTPSEEIIEAFLETSEKEKNALAVHCKAGLGRTGSLIACYAMKHFGFPADAFIGFIRIMRPGSVLGPQQHFLNEIQDRCFKKGQIYRKAHNMNDDLCLKFESLNIPGKKVAMTKDDIDKMENGDFNQGERLNARKNK